MHPPPINVSSTALEASHVIAQTGGRLMSITIYNDNAAAQKYQLHDATSLPADAAAYAGPILTVPTKESRTFTFGAHGRKFATGIVVCSSSTIATKTIGGADSFFDAQVL